MLVLQRTASKPEIIMDLPRLIAQVAAALKNGVPIEHIQSRMQPIRVLVKAKHYGRHQIDVFIDAPKELNVYRGELEGLK